MMLVMEPLGHHMTTRPRYWRRLFSVLCSVCQGDTPSLILQVKDPFPALQCLPNYIIRYAMVENSLFNVTEPKYLPTEVLLFADQYLEKLKGVSRVSVYQF